MDKRLRVKELLNIICSMVHNAMWYSCYNEGNVVKDHWSSCTVLVNGAGRFYLHARLRLRHSNSLHFKKNAKYFVHGPILLIRCAWILFKALKWISSQSVLHKLSIREAYLIPRLHYSEITSLLLLLMDLSQSRRHIAFDIN